MPDKMLRGVEIRHDETEKVHGDPIAPYVPVNQNSTTEEDMRAQTTMAVLSRTDARAAGVTVRVRPKHKVVARAAVLRDGSGAIYPAAAVAVAVVVAAVVVGVAEDAGMLV